MVGCSPDLGLIQTLAIHFCKLWQILKNKERVLTILRGQAFLSIKLPVSVTMIEKEKEKETEKEKEEEKETEKEKEEEKEKEMEKETEKERERDGEGKREGDREGGGETSEVPAKAFGELSSILNTMCKVAFSHPNLSPSV